MFSLCEFSLYDKMLQGSVKGYVWSLSFNLFFSLGRSHFENNKVHLSNYIDKLGKQNYVFCLNYSVTSWYISDSR